MNTKIIASVVVGVIIGGGSFFAGTKYQGASKSQRSENFATMGQGGQMRGGQNGSVGIRDVQGGGMTVGEILSKDENSITIKLASGGSKIVFFGESTAVIKSAVGSIADLKINENVAVSGLTNSDGSMNAQSIQIGNVGMMFGGRTQGQSVQ